MKYLLSRLCPAWFCALALITFAAAVVAEPTTELHPCEVLHAKLAINPSDTSEILALYQQFSEEQVQTLSHGLNAAYLAAARMAAEAELCNGPLQNESVVNFQNQVDTLAFRKLHAALPKVADAISRSVSGIAAHMQQPSNFEAYRKEAQNRKAADELIERLIEGEVDQALRLFREISASRQDKVRFVLSTALAKENRGKEATEVFRSGFGFSSLYSGQGGLGHFSNRDFATAIALDSSLDTLVTIAQGITQPSDYESFITVLVTQKLSRGKIDEADALVRRLSLSPQKKEALRKMIVEAKNVAMRKT